MMVTTIKEMVDCEDEIKSLKEKNLELLGVIVELEDKLEERQAVVAEALSNMEYYPASLGEMWLVQDSDITAMQDAIKKTDDD